VFKKKRTKQESESSGSGTSRPWFGSSDLGTGNRQVPEPGSGLQICILMRFQIGVNHQGIVSDLAAQICWQPCFKYRPSRPRYRPISLFLPAADTIWENRLTYRLQ